MSRSWTPPTGRAGHSARQHGRQQRRTIWTRAALPLLALTGASLILFDRAPLLAVACWAAAALLLARLRRRLTRTRAWDAGSAGEATTARWLWPLRLLGFKVLHDLAIPGSNANLDHVVIGWTGAFMIDTKRWRGPVRLRRGILHNGDHPQPRTLTTVRWEADQLRHMLGGQRVCPVIVFHTRGGLPLRRRVGGIWLVGPVGMLAVLLARVPVLGLAGRRATIRSARQLQSR